jgi:hypothetical protein
LVEIDEEGLPHDVGLVHAACLHPTHRVIGRGSIDVFTRHSLPSDFDHRAWIETRPTGQGAFNAISPTLQGRIVRLGWKPGRSQSAVGNWGVSYELEDGSVRFVRERGRVKRLTEPEAEEESSGMNLRLAEAEIENDPFCVSSESGAFATYSSLLRHEPRAHTVKVVSSKPQELTRSILMANDEVDNFYAPLLSLIDAGAGRPLVIEGMRVLLTDPLRVSESIGNWRKSGLEVPVLHTTVINSDADFDVFVMASFRADEGVVVDPVLAPSGLPIAGFVVVDFEAMMRETTGS